MAYAAIVFALAAAIGQGYYYKKYGKVKRERSRSWLELAVVIAVAVVVGPAILVDFLFELPVLTAPLCMAVGFWFVFKVSYSHVGTTRVHYVVLAALAAFALLPLTGAIDSSNYHDASLILIGLAFIPIGIVDHVRLTQAMGSANVAHQ